MDAAGQGVLLVAPGSSKRRRALAGSVSIASGACLALVLSWHMADTWLAWLAGVSAMFVMAWHEHRLVSRQGLLRVDAQGNFSVRVRSGWQNVSCWSVQASVSCLALRLEGPQGVQHMTIWRDAVEPEGWRRLNLLAVRQQFNLGEPRPGGTA